MADTITRYALVRTEFQGNVGGQPQVVQHMHGPLTLTQLLHLVDHIEDNGWPVELPSPAGTIIDYLRDNEGNLILDSDGNPIQGRFTVQ